MTQRIDSASAIFTALCAAIVLSAGCGSDDEGVASKGAANTAEPSNAVESGATKPVEPLVGEAPRAEPGKLRTIMVDLGQHMARVHTAIWLEDFDGLSASALAVANHPSVSADERGRIQKALGDEFPAFVMTDGEVHNAATRLSDAALAQDMDAALEELAQVQASCVSCHTQFRNRLRVTE